MIDVEQVKRQLAGVGEGLYRGRITRAVGTVLEAEGVPAAIGDLVTIETGPWIRTSGSRSRRHS